MIHDQRLTPNVAIFEPRQTRQWSTAELGWLVGRHVAINVSGSEYAGVVAEAGIGRSGCPWVQFEDGKTVDWHRDTDKTTISVTYDSPFEES
jgi:hypothetical protein